MSEPPSEFWVLATRDSSYMVSEETALSVASKYRQGVELIEVDTLGGGKMFVTRRTVTEIVESSPAIREFEWKHNANMKAEKKSAGYFEDSDG
jgi:hypothetical protein